jgi:N-acetylmuramoyl-L-alanine amidase
MTFDLLTRAEWGATAKQGPAMRLPARGVTFHQTVTRATSDPAADMRTIERIGVQRFGRFSYCYAIHPSGVVGEGAGLTVGAHTAGHNSTRIGVVFIKMDDDPLTPAAETAAVNLLRWLAATGALHQGYDTDGHRDYKATACPSDAIYDHIDAIHAAALAGPTRPTPEPPKGPLMALTDAEQEELLAKVRDLHRDYGVKGKGVRQVILEVDQKTDDLVTGKRPEKS